MDPTVISGLLKRIYTSFDMSSFQDRIKLQKTFYLMQEFGLNLGYGFSLYLHGPYCTELTREAFHITNFKEAKEIEFSIPEYEKKFKLFLKLIEPFKNDPEWLEMASTIMIFKRLKPSAKEEDIIKEVINKHEEWKDNTKKLNDIMKILKEWKLYA
jgi:uncharacterized protein YwgA